MLTASDARRNGPSRWVGRSLVLFGLICLAVYGFVAVQTAMFQRRAKAELQRMVAEQRTSAAVPTTVKPTPPEAPESPTMSRQVPVTSMATALPRGSVVGRIDVPRLHLSAAIAEGDDDSTLGNAVGHLPDTPLPWAPSGNAAFAAHRDGLFRPLRDIRTNDEVKLVTPRGEYLYRVTKMQVVSPEDVWVLAPTPAPTLTLITCYPFSFVGHAPKRFVVQAERVVPDLAGKPLKGKVVQ